MTEQGLLMNAQLLTKLYKIRSDVAISLAKPSSLSPKVWEDAVKTYGLWQECLDVLDSSTTPTIPLVVSICEKSRERLINQYTPYLHSVVSTLLNQYKTTTMTRSELLSEVTLGFLRSIEKYDRKTAEESGASFLTYSRHYCYAYGRRGIQER